MNVVYDTNVYVSGLFWSGPPEDLLKIAASGRSVYLG
jgi:predicted nucleic acid-binding protein